MQRLQVVDSHTGGEPTRVVISGGPELSSRTAADARSELAEHHDWLRRAAILEPRGSDVLVGALLLPPSDSSCVAGVVFFNNVGYLGMCGHGMIGVVVTLGHLGRITAGRHRLETPVGIVTVDFDGGHGVSVENVPSYRYRTGVTIHPEGLPPVTGDIAWGGNWFFLVKHHPWQLELQHVDQLIDVTWRIRQTLERQGITGEGGGLIDHIELFGPPSSSAADSRNFVLCPGKAYDRSPCGTGTSAKIACLMADGQVAPGQTWRQESIVGSIFTASGQWAGDRVIPTISGTAFVTAASELILDPDDPFRWGITA